MNRTSCFARLVGVVLVGSLAGGCQPTGFKITPIPTDRSLKERTLLTDGGFSPPKIALIDVDGMLVNGPKSSLFSEGEHPVSLLLEKLEKAAADDSVKAVVLRINSPGGTVTASDLMHGELLRFKEKTDKPVVAVLMDVAASGGYYIACACDEIVAVPTCVTGSIGVIMLTMNVSGTLTKIGVTTDAITSGPNKDAGSPFRAMKPDERAIFQGIIDEMYEQFLSVVQAGRPGIEPDKLRGLADGRVYTARQALNAGLIDRVGTVRDVLSSVKDRLKVDRVRVVTYHRPIAWQPNIYTEHPQRPVNVSLMNVSLPRWWTRPGPKFLYLWEPGL